MGLMELLMESMANVLRYVPNVEIKIMIIIFSRDIELSIEVKKWDMNDIKRMPQLGNLNWYKYEYFLFKRTRLALEIETCKITQS